MTDHPDSRSPSERPDATGSWHEKGSSLRVSGFPVDDSPTVRSGSGSGHAPAAPGSTSSRKVELVTGPAPPIVSAPVAVPLPRAGERIDMFELEQPIGIGGMGAVFRALDTRLDRHVALKILPPEQAYDTEVVQRFYQEGRAAARLDHENIARVYTIGHDSRFHFIAFEYIEGTTVRQRVEKIGPLPVTEAINFTLQIADALVHAAERGVVHRDIKPSNIIVTPHGRAKLVDMGLARRFERGVDDGLTQSGMTLGTFDYISPEQARDPRDVDVRSDLYSLGCTLFHMLTGRPPFPEGTVLQKLLQHQEEPPPDVRALNPSVTPDLANILVKLMAKDRDRRYQTPEQLVRDLLTVAGALGLRSVSPEGLVWLSAKTPSAWERHLVWGIPTMVLALVVSALVWWGQDNSTVSPPIGASPFVGPSIETKSGRTTAPLTEIVPSPSLKPQTPREPAEIQATEARTSSRETLVDSSEDLLEAIALARPRTTLVLTDDGPYDLGLDENGRSSRERLEACDVTIKAAAGVHPVLRLSRDLPSGAKPRTALLDFAGGHVTLDGLTFQLDISDTDALDAIHTEGTELNLKRCVFRRSGLGTPGFGQDTFPTRVAAVHVRSSPSNRERPPAVTLDHCHVDAGQIGVRAVGPADLQFQDCTIASFEPAVWLDNGRSSSKVAADIRLRHVSVLAGEGPVFRFDGSEPRVWIDDSVVASASDTETTLVSIDEPESLVWRGRGNLYARVGTYLHPTEGPLGREAIRDPLRWKETSEAVRESDSTFESQSVWEDADPAKALAQGSRSSDRVFRLAANHPGAVDVGVRQERLTPKGSSAALALNTVPKVPVAAPTPSSPAAAPATSGQPSSATPERRVSSSRTDRPAEIPTESQTVVATNPDPDPAPEPAPVRMPDLPELAVMPPTPIAGTTERDRDKPVEPVSGEAPEAVAVEKTPAAIVPSRVETGKPDHAVIRTTDQFLNALTEPGAMGRHLHVAADASLELPATTVRATGSWRISAEPGQTRPRLTFLPGESGQKGANAWTSMIELRSGSLQIEGFDIVLPRDNAPRQGRWSAFSVSPATDLNLTNCTVTVEGDQVASAVVAVEAGDVVGEEGFGAPKSSASTVRVRDCLMRVGGDFVDVRAGRRLVLEMDNAVAITGGGLVHAHGVARGLSADRLSLTLRQVTARMAGGLVHLESAPSEPELPVAEISARYSILSTNPKDAPLVLVDGQDAAETMRDRIVWEGQGVGYHQVSTYRRDQSAQLGTVPQLYYRPDWTVAVGAREQSAVHGDLKFRRDWAAGRPAWSLDRNDVELAKDSPARASGSDLERIPVPPDDAT